LILPAIRNVLCRVRAEEARIGGPRGFLVASVFASTAVQDITEDEKPDEGQLYDQPDEKIHSTLDGFRNRFLNDFLKRFS